MCSQVNTEEYYIFVIFLQIFVIVSSCFEVDWNGGADINVCSMDIVVTGAGSKNEGKHPNFLPPFVKSRP